MLYVITDQTRVFRIHIRKWTYIREYRKHHGSNKKAREGKFLQSKEISHIPSEQTTKTYE
jgi:hypothetical protein